jgi:glycosyltransferase involved in cell wall biosynthesis
LTEAAVSVVITTFNDEEYLPQALVSVMQQHHQAREIIVVDDGSDVSPAHILQAFPAITFIRKVNGGLASARNAGLRNVSSEYVCFLDADDRLEPNALSSGLLSLCQWPDAALTYGGHRRIRADGTVAGGENYNPVGGNPYADLLERNLIGMHATVLYRKDVLVDLGGFDEQLPRCEDYDLYLRVSRDYRVVSHPEIIAEYRWHGQNMSRNTEKMLETALFVHGKHRPVVSDPHYEPWERGERNWRAWYTSGQIVEWEQEFPGKHLFKESRLSDIYKKFRNRAVNVFFRRVLGDLSRGWPPPLGAISFGSFISTIPASQDFGWDRGTPIDRYYIEEFLSANASDIRGRVLEIGDDSYSRRFGGEHITQQDVLHVSQNHPKATLTGDLTKAGTLPDNAFDCIVLTQTLHVIFELKEAVEQLYTALKPGGVLLLTVPGISQIDRQEWNDSWCWSFTTVSIRKLFETRFTKKSLEIISFGNVFAATSFLFGAVLEEINSRKLNQIDRAYPVIIALKARKAE